ncbi:MAG: hypothetical protein K8U03_27170 [Planctomycetia bacterium]|nr:hypothetical protein [Planctomycetia bacterium]
MTWLTENPLPPVLLGVIVEAMLAVVLMRTGRRDVLWGMLAVAAMVVGAVVIERVIVTPREEVHTALEEIRALVAANDPPALLKRIDNNPDIAGLRNRVQIDLAHVTVTEAKITELRDDDIKVDGTGIVAKTTFIGSVDLKNAGGQLALSHVVLKFDVELRKRNGVWIITAAEYRSPLGGGPGQPVN